MAALAVCMAGLLQAQDFKASGRKAVQLAPRDWTVEESHGDLNKDGISDLLIMGTPHDETKAYFDENGVWVDGNLPVLAVYFGSGNGYYKLYKTYPQYFHTGGGNGPFAYSAGITRRGTLRFSLSSKAPDESETVVEIFRWQKGDFHKIGRSVEKYSRMTGVTVLDSYNYSTRQHQHLEYRGSADADPDKQELWEDLPDTPLERL